jgi:protein-disulfide isomerase
MQPPSHVDLEQPLGVTDHTLGPGDARVAVVEYGDFECPSCKLAAPAVGMLLRRLPNDVRFGFRHFPLEEAHPHAMQAAQAAECAAAQGKFWNMHKMLFDHQGHLERKDLCGYAEQLGLDMDRFARELDGQVHVQRIREDIASGQRSAVRATPGFFVNGRVQDVSFGLGQLLDAAKAVLSARPADARRAP